jgi:hypothetical protein
MFLGVNVGLLCAALRSEELDSASVSAKAGLAAAWAPLLHKEAAGFQAAPAPGAPGVPSVVRAAEAARVPRSAAQMRSREHSRFFPSPENSGTVPSGSQKARVARSNVPQMLDVDMNIVGGAALLLGTTAGGIGLVAAVEGAGTRNAERANQQECVDCKATKVVECAVCKGTGQDQFASLVAGVKDMAGEEDPDTGPLTIMVDDWDSGPREVVPFADILANYPVKVKTDICIACDGRGIIVCDSCEGTGIQKRFLERYSPDDFMD